MFFSCLALLVLLLARSPFSERTLIATLDPFPDSIHYTNSAFNLLHGKGFFVEREGGKIGVDVPPLYPLTLIPAFFIFNDVRAFYFTNVVLAIISYLLFYRIVRKSFPDQFIQFLVLFSYVACLPLTWYPTLVMAENLILPLFLLGLNLITDTYTWKKGLLMAAVCVSFYATKYASIPLLVSFSLLYLLKIWQSSQGKKLATARYKNCGYFLLALIGLMSVFELFEYLVKGTTIITQIVPLFIKVFIASPPSTSAPGSIPQNVFFSTIFIGDNLKSYLSWLVGGKVYILWKQTQILPPVWAVPAVIGLFVGLIKKPWRQLAVTLLVTLGTVILFMMSFYTTDGRYVYNAFPTLFLGLGFFLTAVLKFGQSLFEKSHLATRLRGLKSLQHWLSSLIFISLGVVILIQNLVPLKSAVMLNLRHAETPWPYISIIRLNAFLKAQAGLTPSPVIPVVISPLSPYYIDYFKTEPMLLLPLSQAQEQRADQTKVWGQYDYQHLNTVYADFLRKKTPVYFASYGIGNDKGLQADRKSLEKDFILKEVDAGCFDVCTIYQLELRPKDASSS